MSLFRYLISVIFLLSLCHNVWPGCVFQEGKYDLSALDLPGGWKVAGPNINGTSSYYSISVCRALNYPSNSSEGGCTNSSVCFFSNGQTSSFGDALDDSKNYAIAAFNRNGFTMFVQTKIQCGTKSIQRATIKFACGPNLGVPELVLISQCQVNFHWKTSAACRIKPKTHQVPCYTLDGEGEKRDLSHLIKPTGGYFVNTPNPAEQFVINVCSDIRPDNSTRGCPSNSSACRIIGSEKLSFGSPLDGLQYTPEGLLLTYKAHRTPAKCNLEPKTTVLFKCPDRGHSQPPKVISSFDCQYEIEWDTEYACPESSLKGDIKTCQFTTETHGVEIDLSPLRQETPYIVKSNSSNTTEFALNVCGGLGENYDCGNQTRWKSMSVCMRESGNHTPKIVGTMVGTKLMYADDEVILTYPQGSFCESSIEHSTVINFICDLDAVNDGAGVPQHVSSDHCVHHFEWNTKYACLKHPLDTPCSVTYENKKINLQKLLLLEGDAWEAIDRRDFPNKDNAEYYINVCGQISSLGNSNCGEGSSACVSFSNGTFLNLGNFTSPPVYDVTSNSVRLEYTGGSKCKSGKNWNSVIDFICRPGLINSEPVLTRVDETECRYEFEWQTAEACPEGVISGTDCKVYDDSLGINFDLSSLKSQTYEVESGQHKYYLGVCEPAKDTPCSKKENSSDVGVCQVDKSNQQSWKTGESNSDMSYLDGVVNLTYLHGDPYNDANQTARMTIIIFICDLKQGKGEPRFVEEVNFAYVFHWYTDLVCQPPAFSTECLVHDPASHLIYDLSGLSSRENWVTHVSEDDGEKQIYLNICRPLARPSVCDSKAAACVTEMTDSGEKAVISNIGRAVGPPVLESPGHLSLVYTHGNPCVAFGKNITYTTVIHFLCGEKFSHNGPMFLNKIGACEYTFLWSTSAACPTGALQAKNVCELTDPDSGFTFDLSSLQLEKQPYSIETSSGIFQFNICGKIMDGCTTSDGKNPLQNTSVCQVDKDGNKISEIATANNYSLSYSQGQDVMLTYKPLSDSPKSSEQEVVIKFPCYNGTVDPKPKFIHHEDGHYVFEMPTRLTCIPGPVDCTAVDSKGNEYDLSPLSKFSDENWEVADFRPENMRLIYHINFCRPLNKVKSYKCPGGASSACQTNMLHENVTGLDLGSQMSPPTVSDTGTVVIRFTNGSFCPNGQFRRSTTINLFCDKYEGELKFIGETPECEYFFSLTTPVACPIQSRNGSDCKVIEPEFGYTFDLNPLKSKNNNYNITVKDFKYFFNVCDKLNGFNNECANSSVCQTKPTDEKFSKSLGLPSDKLTYRKGVITLEYNSGSGDCHGKYNRSTYITFTCDHESKDIDGPEFVGESEDCTYAFEWPTVHACPPFEVIECSAIDKDGKTYDFSQLSLAKSNYLIKNPLSNNQTFVLNLCRSVVHTPDSLCPYTAASCLIDNTGASDSISLGRVNQGPHFEGDRIKIKYTSGDHCDDEKTSTSRFWETIIEFNCNPHVTESEPEFIGKDGCTYYFDWDVAFACSETEPVHNTDDCTVEDPNTGFVYNLTSLSNHGVFKTETANHRYYLNICKSNGTTPCGSGVGICQEEIFGQKRSWKAGQPNSNLQFVRDVLILNYTNGELCHNGLFQRNSIIEFQCGSGIGEPRFLFESSGCTYYFSWKTELACQNSFHCAIKNGSQYYDLSSLAETYHVASSSIINDNAEYYVSVCKPLPLIVNNNHCPPGAGICRIPQDGFARLGESLGKPEIPPFVDFMDKVTIIYSNGSSCKKNPEELLRSRIVFFCDPEAGMGQPVVRLADEDNCIYVLQWRTSLVCPEKPEVQEVLSCNYTDHSRGIYFDLAPLKNNLQPYKVDDENGSGQFLLQMCSSLSSSNITNCKDSGICLVNQQISHSYGVASTQRFSFDGHRLRLTLKNGDDCPSGVNGKYTSEIFFVCDPMGGYGQPVLHKKYACMVVFMWKTSLVCQNMQRQCSFDVNGSHYNFNMLSSLSHNWDTYDEHNNTYWINLCRGIQPTIGTRGCMPSAAVCMKNHNNDYFTLGTIQTMQVKSINSTDLLLTFESGDTKACSEDQTPLSKTVTTRLFMKCGSTLGHPKKFSGPDSECYYDFVWESSLACAERNEIVILEKDGIIVDDRFGFTINISSILNSTFNATGRTGGDEYIYEMNLSGLPGMPAKNPCAMAAVCQTKSTGRFFRDIGSSDTRTLIVRGSELHLTFTSRTKPCGKNPSKNVTTVVNMQCVSAAGIGNPEFSYETGECDYMFDWETAAVCPNFNRITPEPPHVVTSDPSSDPYKEEILSGHSNAAVIVGVIAAAIVITAIGFIVSKPERRAMVAHRFRGVFGRVNFPQFRYGRFNGERLVLVDATEPYPYDDERDVEMIT